MPGLPGLPAAATLPPSASAGLEISIAVVCLAEAIDIVCLAQAMARKSKSVKDREAGNSAFHRMTEGLATALMQVK